MQPQRPLSKQHGRNGSNEAIDSMRLLAQSKSTLIKSARGHSRRVKSYGQGIEVSRPLVKRNNFRHSHHRSLDSNSDVSFNVFMSERMQENVSLSRIPQKISALLSTPVVKTNVMKAEKMPGSTVLVGPNKN